MELNGIDPPELLGFRGAPPLMLAQKICQKSDLKQDAETFRKPEVVIGLTIFVIALVLLGVFTSGLTQQYIIGGSGARQLLDSIKVIFSMMQQSGAFDIHSIFTTWQSVCKINHAHPARVYRQGGRICPVIMLFC